MTYILSFQLFAKIQAMITSLSTPRIVRLSILLLAPVIVLNLEVVLAQQNAKRPNILLIIADDMSMNAGIYGEKAIKTPGMDNLALNGVYFKNAFCTASSCSPSRASILSGKYPHELEEGANLWGTFPAKYPNYTKTLAQAGYKIGLTGKGWGPGQALPGGYKENPAGPDFKSFDDFLAKLPNDAPFCFWIGSSDPHRPYEAALTKKTAIDKSNIKVPAWLPDNETVREDMMDYLAEVKRYDETIEHAIALLKQKGMFENTFIIVTSDNGMPFPRAKANVYTSASNVPLIMSWGNRFTEGKSYNELITLADLAPTILDAANVKATAEMTGKSLLPLLLDNKKDKRFKEVFLERERHANVRTNMLGYPVRAIRTEDYLYVENLKPERWPAGDPDYNVPPSPFGDIDNSGSKEFLIRNRNNTTYAKWVNASLEKRPAVELYNLKKDPDELNNVATNSENQKIIKKLKKRLDEWRRHTNDPLVGTTEDIFDTYPYYGRQQAGKE